MLINGEWQTDTPTFPVFNPATDFEQEGRVYWLQFLEHSLKDAPAPFEMVRERIEELILHRRRTELLASLQERLLEKAHGEGAILRSEAPLQ